MGIVYHENLHWGLSNLPPFFDGEWFTFYFYDEQVTIDSFGIHDAVFDGTNMQFARVNSTNIDDPQLKTASIHVYPNPMQDVLFMESSEEINPTKIIIYTSQGKLIYEQLIKGNSNIRLPDVPGILFLKILFENGDFDHKTIFKL